jgi:hypothetical protein
MVSEKALGKSDGESERKRNLKGSQRQKQFLGQIESAHTFGAMIFAK